MFLSFQIVIYFTDAVLSIRIGTYFTDAVLFIRNMIYFTDVVLFVQIVMYFTDVVSLIQIVMYCMDAVFSIRIVMYFTDVCCFPHPDCDVFHWCCFPHPDCDVFHSCCFPPPDCDVLHGCCFNHPNCDIFHGCVYPDWDVFNICRLFFIQIAVYFNVVGVSIRVVIYFPSVVLFIRMEPHRWCNGLLARLEWGRSWIRAPSGSNQILWNWYLLLLCWAVSITEKRQTLIGSESGYYVRMGWHVIPRTVVSVSYH